MQNKVLSVIGWSLEADGDMSLVTVPPLHYSAPIARKMSGRRADLVQRVFFLHCMLGCFSM